jgi:eukaryotic-like serine/threonine-protein kinase
MAVGKYRVIERLDEGGMGMIYLARDPGLDRLVAIKVLRHGFDSDDLRDRFEREARAISRLRHPNIITIFEYGE